MPSLRKAVLAFSWLSAAEAVRVGTTALVVVYVARRLGAPVFGYYAFAIAVIGALLALVDGGLTSVGSREVARRSADVRSIVKAILAIRLTFATLAFLLLLTLVANLDKPSMARLVILVGGCSLFTFALTLDWLFYGLGQSPRVAGAAIVRVAVFAGLTLAFVRNEGHVWLLPLFQAAGELLAAGLLAFAYFRGLPRAATGNREPGLTEVESPIRRIAQQAWPLGAGQLMRAVNFWFSVILIGLIADDASTGRFAAAQRITQFSLGFASLYFAGYLPLITQGVAQGHAVARRLTADSLHMTALVTLPLAAGGALLADPIVRLVFGEDYGPGAPALAILFWTIPSIILAGHFRMVLIASDRVRVDLTWVTLSAAANVLLSIPLLRVLGLTGAALASATAECVLALGVFWSVRTTAVGVPVLAVLARPAAASGLMAIAVLMCRASGLAVAIPVGVVTYLLALAALGERWPGS